jgi:hypothetical protein
VVCLYQATAGDKIRFPRYEDSNTNAIAAPPLHAHNYFKLLIIITEIADGNMGCRRKDTRCRNPAYGDVIGGNLVVRQDEENFQGAWFRLVWIGSAEFFLKSAFEMQNG